MAAVESKRSPITSGTRSFQDQPMSPRQQHVASDSDNADDNDDDDDEDSRMEMDRMNTTLTDLLRRRSGAGSRSYNHRPFSRPRGRANPSGSSSNSRQQTGLFDSSSPLTLSQRIARVAAAASMPTLDAEQRPAEERFAGDFIDDSEPSSPVANSAGSTGGVMDISDEAIDTLVDMMAFTRSEARALLIRHNGVLADVINMLFS